MKYRSTLNKLPPCVRTVGTHAHLAIASDVMFEMP